MKNKVAIVTGGASGIGEATVLLFVKEGASVVVSDIDKDKGEQLVEKIKKDGGQAAFFKTDVSKAKDNEDLVDFAVKTFGKLDVAVNNAGIGGEANKIAEMSLEGWQQVIDVNLHSIFYGMKYEIAAMLKNGGGSIVNVSSILGSVGFEGSAAYVAAKHAILGITKTAALEYSAENIRTNCVGPGFIKTPLLDQLEEDVLKQVVAMHPIGRLGKSEEVAELILWLASDKSSFVTGAYYPVDGGYLSR